LSFGASSDCRADTIAALSRRGEAAGSVRKRLDAKGIRPLEGAHPGA
jgi:hypothetical protein